MDLIEELSNTEAFKRLSEFKLDLKVIMYTVITFISLYLLANFPEITIPRAFGGEIIITLIPYALKLPLKYLINVLEFFGLLAFIFIIHGWIIIQCINIYLFIKKLFNAINKFLENF